MNYLFLYPVTSCNSIYKYQRAHSEVRFRLPEDPYLPETFGGLGSEDGFFCSYIMNIEKLGSQSDSTGPSAPKSENPFSEAENLRPIHGNNLSFDGFSN